MQSDSGVLTKEAMQQREEEWKHVAREEGYKCAVCGQIPPYGERHVYFETGLCGFHAHAAKKD